MTISKINDEMIDGIIMKHLGYLRPGSVRMYRDIVIECIAEINKDVTKMIREIVADELD
jgi:hypothetical protein